MSQRTQHAVNGFYPCPVPVSLSDQAAVFAACGRLYRVDSRRNALGRTVSGEITQVVQTGRNISALEWTGRGEAVLWTLDRRLQTLDRQVLLRSGRVELDRMPDPYDLTDWRNLKEFVQLTPEYLFRLSFQPDRENDSLTAALVLERTPLEGGETVRYVIDGPVLEAALGGETRFHYFDIRSGDTQMWADGDRVFFSAVLWDWNCSGHRHVLLQIGGDGQITALWDSKDVLAGRPCFFDFEQDIMWTCSRPGEAEHPEEDGGRRNLPMVARRIAKDAPVLPRFPVWRDVELFQEYFDGVHSFAGLEGYPVVLWQDRLLLDREGTGCLMAYPAQKGPLAEGEALNVQWLPEEGPDFPCERPAGVV